jgi:tetratricopeptide (TPR) repeat protein
MVEHRLAGIFETGPASSVARRLYFYRGAWQAFLSSPVIGQGIGNFAVFISKFRSPDYWMVHSEDIVPHAHNEFLEILSETGILGFAGFIAVLILCTRSALIRLRAVSAVDRHLLTGVLAAIAAILVDNLSSINLRTIPVAATFWVLLALAARSDIDDGPSAGIGLPSWTGMLRAVPYLLVGAACAWYLPAVAAEYQAQRQYLIGNLLRVQNKTEESTIRYRAAMAYDPDLGELRFYLGANLAELGRFEEAKRTIDTLLSQNPYFPQARFILGISLFNLGDTVGAVKALDEELRIETSPQTVYYASMFQHKLRNPSRELELITSLLRNAVRSKSNQFVPEGVARFAELCPALGNSQECVELADSVKKAFP